MRVHACMRACLNLVYLSYIIQGINGSIGDQGPNGTKGDIGDMGDVGLKGEVGLQGENGTKGILGPPGEMGPLGDNVGSLIFITIYKFITTFFSHMNAGHCRTKGVAFIVSVLYYGAIFHCAGCPRYSWRCWSPR